MSKHNIIVGRMAYERYRLIQTKDGIIRQGMGLSGKVKSISIHVTGTILVIFSTDSQYNAVPIDWVTTDENISKIDIGIIESNKILINQTKHILANSRIRLNRKNFTEKLETLEKLQKEYARN